MATHVSEVAVLSSSSGEERTESSIRTPGVCDSGKNDSTSTPDEHRTLNMASLPEKAVADRLRKRRSGGDGRRKIDQICHERKRRSTWKVIEARSRQ